MEKVIVKRKKKTSYLPKATQEMLETRKIAQVRSHLMENNLPLNPFTPDEEAKYLADVLAMDPKHADFRKECRAFWANKVLEVPQQGAVLNITLDDKGYPVNVADWVTYKWLLIHARVDKSNEPTSNSQIKDYYMYNPNSEIKKANETVKLTTKAFKEFAKLEATPEKFDWVLRLFSTSKDLINPLAMTELEKENKLGELIQKNPDKFIEIVTDPNLELKFELELMVDMGIITKVGNRYIDGDVELGIDAESAIAQLKSARYSKEYAVLKAKLAQLTKGKLKTKKADAPKAEAETKED